MPTPHYRFSPISRGSQRMGVVHKARGGGSAADKAAYVDRGGQYASRADDVLARGNVGPDLGDWTVADRWELRKDAVVARETIAAVPHCLPLAQQIAVAREHAEYLRRAYGVCVKWALHRAGDGDHRNIHIHFLLTTRAVADNGQHLECKVKSFNRRTGGRDTVAAMRAAWQDCVNAALCAAGQTERLDLRTLAAQGIQREAQQRVPTAEYMRARRGEIRSKRYEHNQRLAALRAATDACAEIAAELAAARRDELRERADRAVDRSKRSVARATRRVAGSQQLAERTARSLRASADYRRGASVALEQRRGRKRAGPSAVRTKLLRADVDHVDHEGLGRGSDERHSAGINGDELKGRPDRQADARAGERSERPEGRVAAAGSVASVAAVPPAEAKVGFFARIWRRLIGPAYKASEPATPPPVQTKTETPPKITETQKETKANPPPSKIPVVEQVPASVQPDDAAVVEVLKIETKTGGVFYVRKTVWENRADKIDVPLCDAAGQPVQTGQRAKLRVSSIRASEPTPVIVSPPAREQTSADASEYLPPPATDESENLTL